MVDDMVGEDIAEFEFDCVVVDTVSLTIAGEGARDTIDGDSVVDDTVDEDVSLCSSGDLVGGIVAAASSGLLKGAPV